LHLVFVQKDEMQQKERSLALGSFVGRSFVAWRTVIGVRWHRNANNPYFVTGTCFVAVNRQTPCYTQQKGPWRQSICLLCSFLGAVHWRRNADESNTAVSTNADAQIILSLALQPRYYYLCVGKMMVLVLRGPVVAQQDATKQKRHGATSRRSFCCVLSSCC
jgi:hypothetical protein